MLGPRCVFTKERGKKTKNKKLVVREFIFNRIQRTCTLHGILFAFRRTRRRVGQNSSDFFFHNARDILIV